MLFGENMLKKFISNIIEKSLDNYLKNLNIDNDINIENIEIGYSVDDKFGESYRNETCKNIKKKSNGNCRRNYKQYRK